MPCWEANAMNAVKARIRLRDRDSEPVVPMLVLWENGRSQSPAEYLDDRSVMGNVE